MDEIAKIQELRFGEYSAIQEFRRDPDYFETTFLDPESFSMDRIGNSSDYIIVGRKGAGKSTCCIAMGVKKEREGYTHSLLSFNDDLKREDLSDLARSQTIELADLAGLSGLYESISELYDFREVWKRKVIFAIAQAISTAGAEGIFSQFCSDNSSYSEKLSDGIGKNLLVDAIISPAVREKVATLFNNLTNSNGRLPLASFNAIALKLLASEKDSPKHYFFFDELNISTIQTTSDEYDLKLALVRDIIRAANELNEFFLLNRIDCHVVCSLRPEVRDQLNRLDPELSKILDSNFVNLSWGGESRVNHPLLEILHKKTNEGVPDGKRLSPGYFPKTVASMGRGEAVDTYLYVLNLSWNRPRDIIRMLKSYQKTNGATTSLFSGDITKFLKEYSRVSAVECLAELSVKYGEEIVSRIRSRITRRYYSSVDELQAEFEILENRLRVDELIDDLFYAGVILNYDRVDGKTVFYASYREDDRLDPDLQIMVHRGLWSDFHLAYRKYDN